MTRAVVAVSTLLLSLSGCQSTPLPDSCYQKPESGRCRAAHMRYYFEPDENRCKAFIWGGCGGVVPFDTEQACFEQCGGEAPAPSHAAQEKLDE